MTILVTGAGGFIGRALAPALAAAGAQVRAAARHPAKLPSQPGVAAVALPDLAAAADWAPLLDGVTHVVHLAGIAHAMGGVADASYDAVNARATATLAEAAAARGAKLVFVSSVRAQSGPVADTVLTEADPPARPTPTAAPSWPASRRSQRPAVATSFCARCWCMAPACAATWAR